MRPGEVPANNELTRFKRQGVVLRTSLSPFLLKEVPLFQAKHSVRVNVKIQDALLRDAHSAELLLRAAVSKRRRGSGGSLGASAAHLLRVRPTPGSAVWAAVLNRPCGTGKGRLFALELMNSQEGHGPRTVR